MLLLLGHRLYFSKMDLVNFGNNVVEDNLSSNCLIQIDDFQYLRQLVDTIFLRNFEFKKKLLAIMI